MDENLSISFQVVIYRHNRWTGARGDASCEVSIPRLMLDELDPGNIFLACLKTAIAQFDRAEAEETGDG